MKPADQYDGLEHVMKGLNMFLEKVPHRGSYIKGYESTTLADIILSVSFGPNHSRTQAFASSLNVVVDVPYFLD